jgi:hypothetical protein
MIDLFQILPDMNLTARMLIEFIQKRGKPINWQIRPGRAVSNHFTRVVPVLPTKAVPIPEHITPPLPPLPAAHTYKNTQVCILRPRFQHYSGSLHLKKRFATASAPYFIVSIQIIIIHLAGIDLQDPG